MAAKTVDAVLVGAVELARAAAEEAAARPSDVGEHLGTVVEEERVVSHRFAAAAAGYRGWHWTVTLARVPRGRVATVSEVELLPGDDALLAAPWVPWAERLRPGDLGAGDVLPFLPDDPRLQPGYSPSDDDEYGPPIEELALVRARALGPQGRDEAAQRWHLGSHGPTSPVALASTSPCASCGFLVPLSGSLGQVFGVCANEWSPDDGKVVSLDHGCGAHSETDAEAPPSLWPAPNAKAALELVSTDETAPTAGSPDVGSPEAGSPDAGSSDAGSAESKTAAAQTAADAETPEGDAGPAAENPDAGLGSPVPDGSEPETANESAPDEAEGHVEDEAGPKGSQAALDTAAPEAAETVTLDALDALDVAPAREPGIDADASPAPAPQADADASRAPETEGDGPAEA